MVVVIVGGEHYHMNDSLKTKWDRIKDGKLAKRDEDRVYIVDGRERSGKSVWTLQQGAYIDPTILEDGANGELLPRITYSPRETIDAIRSTKSTKEQTKVIIWDEAFRGISSSSGLSKVNKEVKQVLQEMGQNNIVLFLVSPSFFILELYAAVLRSEALFHIVKNKKYGAKRMYLAFNHQKKGNLYRKGVRKGWNYRIERTGDRGWFFNRYPGGKTLEKRYRKKKWDSLRRFDMVISGEVESKFKIQRDLLLKDLYTKLKSYRKASNEAKALGVDISYEQVRAAVLKGTEKEGKMMEKPVILSNIKL